MEHSHNNHESGDHLTSGRLWHRNTCGAWSCSPSDWQGIKQPVRGRTQGFCRLVLWNWDVLFLKWALLPGDAAGRCTVFSSGVAVVQQQNDAFLWKISNSVTDKCRVLYINQQLLFVIRVFTDVRFQPSILHGSRESVFLPSCTC